MCPPAYPQQVEAESLGSFSYMRKCSKYGVPYVVHERREKSELTKDIIPFGLSFFFRLLRSLLLAYRCWHVRFSRLENTEKPASAIVNVFMDQNTS